MAFWGADRGGDAVAVGEVEEVPSPMIVFAGFVVAVLGIGVLLLTLEFVAWLVVERTDAARVHVRAGAEVV